MIFLGAWEASIPTRQERRTFLANSGGKKSRISLGTCCALNNCCPEPEASTAAPSFAKERGGTWRVCGTGTVRGGWQSSCGGYTWIVANLLDGHGQRTLFFCPSLCPHQHWCVLTCIDFRVLGGKVSLLNFCTQINLGAYLQRSEQKWGCKYSRACGRLL